MSLIPVQIWCDRLDTRTYVHTYVHTCIGNRRTARKLHLLHVSVISYVAPRYARNVNQQELACARARAARFINCELKLVREFRGIRRHASVQRDAT